MSDFEQEEELATVAQVKAMVAKGQPPRTTPFIAVAALAAVLGIAGGFLGAQFAGTQGEKGDTGAQGIQGDKGESGEPGISGELPKNAVVAFDNSAGCPGGWEPFLAAQSRAIIGATFGTGSEPGLGNNEYGSALIERKYRDHGGAEAVILRLSQIPTHNHGLLLTMAAGPGADLHHYDNPSARDLIASSSIRPDAPNVAEGQNQPHNNMPPYIALYFCQKS